MTMTVAGRRADGAAAVVRTVDGVDRRVRAAVPVATRVTATDVGPGVRRTGTAPVGPGAPTGDGVR